jgi:hypothetical protein
MHSRAPGIALLALAFSGSAAAATPDLKSLAWMAGTWTGVADGVEMEEVWTAPKAQSMLGLHRDAAEGRTVSFEFLRIEATADAITYWASPKGRPATPFKLVDGGQKRAVFENPEHDFPRRILYWLGDDGSLHARVEGTRAGKSISEEWRWRRAPTN